MRDKTERSFSEKWLTDVGRVYGKKDDNVEEQFLSILGAASENDLYNIFEDGTLCLDAGCGVGWAEELFNINKNMERYAVDLSDSVLVAQERTKHMDNVHVIKADIGRLPFRKNVFDIIFSNGVLHHTGNTEKYFSKLCYHLKPGGLIGVYIYCKKPFIRDLVDTVIRENYTTYWSFDECLKFSKTLSKLGRSFQNINEYIIIEEDIPLLNIESGVYRVHDFIYNHFLKCFYNDKQGLDVSTLVNVDWYHPAIATFHTLAEITGWFEDNNIIESVKVIQPKGWEHSGWFVSGRKARNGFEK